MAARFAELGNQVQRDSPHLTSGQGVVRGGSHFPRYPTLLRSAHLPERGTCSFSCFLHCVLGMFSDLLLAGWKEERHLMFVDCWPKTKCIMPCVDPRHSSDQETDPKRLSKL